jgi:hypothetical protein
MRRLLVLLCILAVPALARAQAQATSGQVTGQVVDSSGAVLPGATVTAFSQATGFTRTAVASGDGLYTLALLPPGDYEISAELSGFQPTKISGVTVTVGSNLTINIKLGVGGVSENVTVSSQAASVETTSSKGTNTLNSAAIENLPINGRRFQDFVSLTPTAQVDPSRGQISLSGQRGINSNVSIDGADYNQPFFGGIRGGERSNLAFTIPQEAIGEFQVLSSGFSAEFGRSSGGVVNAVTKSGTNTLRGSAFYLNRPKKLAEKNAFDQPAAFDQTQFGGSVGGPVKTDRVFFFGAYEQQKFTAPRQVLFDNLVGFAPSAIQQEAYDFFKTQEQGFENTNDAWTWLGRTDVQVNAANRFSVRYNGSRNTALNGAGVGGRVLATTTSALSNDGTEKDSTHTVVGDYTSVLSPTMLLTVRGQYSRENRPRLANSETPTFSTNVGTFGARSFLPTTQYDWRAQTAASLTMNKGRHNAKAGFEYNRTYADQAFGFNQFGAFNIAGTNTGTILELMSTGGTTPNRLDSTTVTYNRQIGNRLVAYGTNEAAFYAQDTWRLKPSFTVNYGLRWEGQYNAQPAVSNQALYDSVRNFVSPDLGRGVDPAKIANDTKQWGPRAGFAWDPGNDGKTVVRGYAGLYYARTPSIIFSSAMNNFRTPPGDLSLTLPLAVPAGNLNNTVYKQLALIGIDLNQYTLNNLPVLSIEQVQSIGAALGLTPNAYQGAAVTVMDPDFRNPQARQYGFGVEREIRPKVTVGAEFQEVRTKYLQRNRDFNLPVPTIRASDPAQRPFYGLVAGGVIRPLASLGSITVRESTAKSDFKALTLSAKYRPSWGQMNIYYVLSKSKSDDDNERDASGFQYEDVIDLSSEYAPSNLDRRHQFNGNIVTFLPYGFDVSSGFSLRSGRPISATYGSDVNEDRGGPDRPYSAPGVPFERNSFRNEPLYEVNLRVQKSFNLGASSRRVLLSAEFFNLFNTKNIELAGTAVTNYCTPVAADCGFSGPTNVNFLSLKDQNPTSARFGQYLLGNTPGSPFQAQLGVRFQF